MVRASAEAVVPRTVAIDAAVRARPTPQVVILGAGLDGRAWRLTELAGVEVSRWCHRRQQDKRERVARSHDRAGPLGVPVDLTRDTLGDALETAGHLGRHADGLGLGGRRAVPHRADVAKHRGRPRRSSAPGSALVVNYQAHRPLRRLRPARSPAGLSGWPASRPLAGRARRPGLTPPALHALLAGHGFVVDTDEDLLAIARTLPMPVRQLRSLQNGRVAVATRWTAG